MTNPIQLPTHEEKRRTSSDPRTETLESTEPRPSPTTPGGAELDRLRASAERHLDIDERTAARRRARAIGALVVAVLVIVAATWFSNAQSVQEIATQGTIGVRAEATLSVAAVARNRVVQASLLVQAADLNVADPDAIAGATASAQAAIVELDRRATQLQLDLGPGGPQISESAAVLGTSLSQALAALTDTSAEQAADRIEAVDDRFDELALLLVDLRDSAVADMVVARDTAGQVALASRVVVAFLIPMSAILLYRFVSLRAARRRELERELEQERTMLQSKDELIANISHELRTPLTGILGFSQTAALEEGLTSEDYQSMTAMIASEADELTRMVDDLITTARDDGEALVLASEAMDPNDELDAVLIPASVAGRHIEVDVQPAPVFADRLRFRQIMRNLVSNAMKYGGPRVSLRGRIVDSEYELRVIDDGGGVPADVEGRLFTRYVHRGDSPLTSGSVGLGTSIARRLAEMMGGSLEYERRDQSTHFVVKLPLSGSSPYDRQR